MLKKSIAIIGILLCLMIFVTSANGLPDLTITKVATGTPNFISPNKVDLPLTVTIKNIGDATSNPFKLSVDVSVKSSAGTCIKYLEPFTVPGSSDIWYPWKSGLARGETYSFRGTLHIVRSSEPSLHGLKILILPWVDSNAADEFTPSYGRVEENDEGNNES